jgi:hypothetical protein
MLTLASIALCAVWGWTRLQRIPGVVVATGGSVPARGPVL